MTLIERNANAATAFSDIPRQNREIAKSTIRVQTGNRDIDRSDFTERTAPVLVQIFDSKRELIDVLQTKQNNEIILSERLDNREAAYNELRDDVITKILEEYNDLGDDIEAKKEWANIYLAKIQELLNKQINGEYIWGGKNTDIAPIPDNINLTNDSNIIDGEITDNYTVAEDFSFKIDVSIIHTIDDGDFTASSSGIKKLIASLNLFKSDQDGDFDKAIAVFNEAKSEIDSIGINNSENKKILESASLANTESLAKANSIRDGMTKEDLTILVKELTSNIQKLQVYNSAETAKTQLQKDLLSDLRKLQ